MGPDNDHECAPFCDYCTPRPPVPVIATVQRSTPVIPFVAHDNLVHRVSADTQRNWIEEHQGQYQIRLLTQCGETLIGRIHPEGSHLVTCLFCIAREVRGAQW